MLPSDGSAIGGCDVQRIYLMFSRPVREDSLVGALHVTPGAVDSVQLYAAGSMVELTISGLLGTDREVRFALEVDTSLTDLDGRALDQIPSEEGAQAYTADFALVCTTGMGLPDSECGRPMGPLPPTCAFPERLACVDGFCVPRGCDQSACTQGTRCDPATDRCTLDCRPWGDASVCPPARPICDAASGLCVAG